MVTNEAGTRKAKRREDFLAGCSFQAGSLTFPPRRAGNPAFPSALWRPLPVSPPRAALTRQHPPRRRRLRGHAPAPPLARPARAAPPRTPAWRAGRRRRVASAIGSGAASRAHLCAAAAPVESGRGNPVRGAPPSWLRGVMGAQWSQRSRA